MYPSAHVLGNLQVIRLDDIPGVYSLDRIPHILDFAIREAFVRGQMRNFNFLKTKDPARWNEEKERYSQDASEIVIPTMSSVAWDLANATTPRTSQTKLRVGKMKPVPPEWKQLGVDRVSASAIPRSGSAILWSCSTREGQTVAYHVQNDDKVFVTVCGADRAWHSQWLEDNGLRPY